MRPSRPVSASIPLRAVLSLLVVCCTLAACTLPSEDVPEAEATLMATPPPEVSPEPSPTPPADPPEPSGERCDPSSRDAMTGVVRDQLALIAERDWDGALALTTVAFRDQFDAPAFERVILDSFPVVADAVAADTGVCVLATEAAGSLIVTVEDADGTQRGLLYLLEREPAGWRISGAVPEDGGGPGDGGGITA